MFGGRKDLRYLALAVFVVLLGLFNSGLDDELAGTIPPPHSSFITRPLYKLAYHYRQQTKEELFYHCFGQMALGREHDREFLQKHRGDLGEYERGMLGPEITTGPILPYRDYIAEYPPVNFPFIAGPSLVGAEVHQYATAFRITMALLIGGAFLMSVHLAARLGLPARQVRYFMVLSLAGAVLLGPIMVTRLDGVTLFCFVAAMVAVSHERPILAGLMMGLATGAKIVPLFLIPFVFVHWWMGKQPGKAVRYAVSSIVSIGLIFVPALLLGPENFRAMFRFHGERPVQTESTFAVLMRLQELLFDAQVRLVHSYGSWNLDGASAGLFKTASTPLALGTVGVMLLVYRNWLAKEQTLDPQTRLSLLLRALGATVAGLMAFSKVFSPQYLIWTWPWLFLSERARRPLYDALCLSVLFCTQLIAHGYGTAVVKGDLQGIALLAGRNFSLIILLLWLARRPRESIVESRPDGDWGRKTVVVPLLVALLAATVSYQSRSLEAEWLRPTPTNETPGFNRVEFATTSPGDLPRRRGYNGLEVDEDGNTFDWTAKPEVEHYFPYGRIASPAIVEFRGLNALIPELDEAIELKVNDRPLEHWVTEKKWPRIYTAWIPTEALFHNRWNRLTLHTPTPVSPRALGIGNDFRRLGIQMDWVSFNAVDGFARFFARPPAEVLAYFSADDWVMRGLFSEPPASGQWRQVGDDYWEAPFNEQELPEGTVWLYRPGDFYGDFARLPVGPGWLNPSSDAIDRPYREVSSKGRLTLSFPPGRSRLSFNVLKKEKDSPETALTLLVNGEKRELAMREREWSTFYETEIESDGGTVQLVFEKASILGESPALGVLSVRPLAD